MVDDLRGLLARRPPKGISPAAYGAAAIGYGGA
jgi:hypothetical protein